MPIAKIQLPDGRIARFEVAEGTTPEQVTAFASQNLGGLEKPEVAQDPSLLSKIGTATVEGLAGFTEGLGRAAVGATQFGAEMIGQEEFAGRIGQQVAKEKELEKDDPTARKVGRFIGGIAPALPVGAGMGLIRGGIAGGAAAELIEPTEKGTAKERVEQVALGAGLGGLTGGALLGAGKAIKGTAGVVKRQFVTTKPEDIIARGIRPEDAAPLLDQLKKGQEVVLPDIAGDEIRGLTRSVAKMSGAKDIITDALEGRSFKAVERVSNQLSKDVSPTGSYFGSLDDLAKARSEVAAPLYKKAFDKGTVLDVEKNRELFEKIAPDIADARKKFRIPNVSEIKDPLVKQAKQFRSFDDFLNSVPPKQDGLIGAMDHRPTKTGATASNITQEVSEMGFPSDFYKNPQYYEDMGDKSVQESFRALMKVKNNPNATITIYRSSPVDDLRNGDWVTLSKEYAKDHSLYEGVKVYSFKVKAKDVEFSGDSINEFGYFGHGTKEKDALKEVFNKSKTSTKGIADNSIVMLDAAKKSLDDKIGKAIRQGERQEASILQGIKKELVSKLDELNPDYKKARQVFSDFSSIQNAQEQGLQFSKLRPEQITKTLKDMSVAEKDAFRIGVRESLDKVVQKTPFGSDPAKRIFGNSEIRNKLKASLGSDSKFNNFKSRMEEEIAGAETKFKVLGGSRSDFNLSADDAFIDKVASGIDTARGNRSELIRAVVTSLKSRAAGLNKNNAKQVAEILVNRKKGIEALQSIIDKEDSLFQKRVLQTFIKSLRPEVTSSQAIKESSENE